jgi:formylglycine-generating enzyme required for sulfatase activity/tetratricopeptide (TPR) repeat protein
LRNRDIVAAVNGGSRASAEYLSSCMTANTREIVGSVQTVGQRLADVENAIDDMGREITDAFTWGFNELLASQGGMQASLDQLVKLAKTPAQTAAYEQFEIARDAFRQGLYLESLEALEHAIAGVPGISTGYKLEWRFHQLRGLVLLGSHENTDPKVIDAAKAEEAFVLAARYARKDAPADAAKAMLSAGWAAYVQGSPAKLAEALAHTEEAVALDPQLGEALFQVAKFQMALGNPDAALPVLAKASEFGGLYIAKAAADGDFKKHDSKLAAFLRALRDEKARQVFNVARPIAEKIARLMKECPELAKNEIAQRLVGLVLGASSAALVDLAEYLVNGLQRDVEALKSLRFMIAVETVPTGEVRMVPSGRTERVPTGRMESYEVTEVQPYEEEVVVRPAGWFRKEVREIVRKTRQVKVTTQRPELVERPIMVEQPVTREVFRAVRTRGPETCKILVVDGTGADRSSPQGTVIVPPGSFTMGGERDSEADQSEKPLHAVFITHAFEIFSMPVTQDFFRSVTGSNSSYFKGERRPVENVNWFDAVRFCNALSKSEGLPPAYKVSGTTVTLASPQTQGWRLPTEAEWEYACRAGTTGARYGNLDEIAWYGGNSGRQTHPVGEKKPNAWGLYDMLGNVYEWVQDIWHDNYAGAPSDGSAWMSGGDQSQRVLRGGSWNLSPQYLRSAERVGITPDYRSNNTGFRIARTL